MKALLLAAGLGTRLRPITNNIPKCLVPIHGRPLLDIWLENLTKAGIGPFLVNTHYFSEQVEKYIATSKYSESVKLVYEEALLGTAGTLRKNANFFNGEDGMLIHADNYCICDFEQFLQLHRNRPDDIEVTMMSFRTSRPETCGILELDEKNIVINFHEKIENPPGNLANGAVYILSAKQISEIAKGNKSDFSTEILPNLLGKIMSCENQNVLIDIGTPEEYQRAQTINIKL